MIVVGICGSPRKKGNTDILLDEALKGAASGGVKTEKIVLNDLKFSPCQECGVTNDDGTCKVKDDFQSVYGKIKDADALILAAPIFFGSLSAQTKMMIDRFQCLWKAKYILKKAVFSKKKKGAFLCVEASKRAAFLENARSIVRNLFATVNAEYSEELLVPGVDEKGKILEFPDTLNAASELGKKLVFLK
ncbi:flavodoxin family protein [Candidatus Omnitrophota bacterium]